MQLVPKGIRYEGLDWTHRTKYVVQCWNLTNSVTNSRVLYTSHGSAW